MFKAYDNVKRNEIKRGDIYYVNLPEQNGHVQGGVRPVLIVQNDTGNKYSPTVIGCPLTTREKKRLPTHTHIKAKSDSTCLCEQLMCIDKNMLGDCIGCATENEMESVDMALAISIGLNIKKVNMEVCPL